ncbi:hypothetical protein FHL15_009695 [Xylaria flabelliformis]|uniref:Uncharacterized protein n=1 Tax=Xylaria flabelliformis TaxID=2512241 RepID=A0A553HNA7_9PEZI|nr:hypothetical protein FHL15_009695 [Xylaria flabelliformis]
MPDTGTAKAISVTDLGKSLRLSSEAETQALLKSNQLTEAFRFYRNRCLVSNRNKAADLPDWHDVDTYFYELRLSTEFRQYVRKAGGKGSKQLESTDPNVAPLDDYLAKLCTCGPYVLMPHVAMFVLRVDNFMDSREGQRFDVCRDTGKGDEGMRERVFDRYLRIMKILTFLVSRHIG